MDDFAGLGLVERSAGFDDPVGQAIAAEAGEAHQVDVLRVVAVAEVADQAAESGGGNRIVEHVERIVRL